MGSCPKGFVTLFDCERFLISAGDKCASEIHPHAPDPPAHARLGRHATRALKIVVISVAPVNKAYFAYRRD